jgi:hypothetical protein
MKDRTKCSICQINDKYTKNTSYCRNCSRIKNLEYYSKNKDKNKKSEFRDNQLAKTYYVIKKRCSLTAINVDKKYADRGIKCEWDSYKDFKNDMYESYMKHLNIYGRKQTTIDRIDNDGNYCKENCRWATRTEQTNNRKNMILYTFNGKTLNCQEWDRELGLSRGVTRVRIKKRGWSLERALSIKENPILNK